MDNQEKQKIKISEIEDLQPALNNFLLKDLIEGDCYQVKTHTGTVEFKVINTSPLTGIIKGEKIHTDFNVLTKDALIFKKIDC